MSQHERTEPPCWDLVYPATWDEAVEQAAAFCDPNILELVAALRYHKFDTYQSCEGHGFESHSWPHGWRHPWVRLWPAPPFDVRNRRWVDFSDEEKDAYTLICRREQGRLQALCATYINQGMKDADANKMPIINARASIVKGVFDLIPHCAPLMYTNPPETVAYMIPVLQGEFKRFAGWLRDLK